MKKIIVLVVVLLTICPFTSFAGSRHDMAGIQFKASNGWVPSVNRFTITIPRSDGSELLMVTHMPSQRNSPSLPEIMGQLAQTGKKFLKNSIEKDLVLREFNRGQVKGYYFTLTDKSPKPGEFKYMTQGTVISGRIFLVFTALSKKSRTPSEAAFAMIASMRPSKRKPVNIFPLLIKENELPRGFKIGEISTGGNPRCYSRQPTFYYSVISEDEKLDSGLKPDFKFYQSFYDKEKHPANLLFMRFSDPQRAVPFAKGLIWGNENRPTSHHPERIFVRGNVLMILCIKPGDEKVYDWIIKKFS